MSASVPRILFVCTGNICRSAAAEVLAAQWARDQGVPLEVDSAGIYGLTGEPVEPTIADILHQRGVATDGFAASRLTAATAGAADLVFCMERHHRNAVLRLRPTLFRRVFLLREAAALVTEQYVTSFADFRGAPRGALPKQDWGIEDPYGKDRDECVRCVDIVTASLEEVLPAIAQES